MRILFLVHRVPYPPNKGDKIRALWELKSLAAAHEVDLFCFYDHQEDRNSIDALRPYCNQCYAEPLSWPGSRVRSLAALLRRKPFTTAFFYTASMARQVKQALAAREYHAVLVFSSSMAQYVEDETSLPRILDMIDVDSAKWTDYSRTSSPLLRWLWRREGRLLSQYEWKIAQSFANTLLCTDAEAALLRRSGAACARVGVLRHMVDSDYFDPSKVEIPAELLRWQPYVVFSGSMDYTPNIDAMKWFYGEVLPAIRARVPEARLVIVGRNPAKSILDLGKDPGVLVTGSVPDVRPYLRAAAVAVAPMLVARGVQNKILESMAMGLPVSSSSRAAMAFPPQVADLIMIEDNPAALANKLVNVIQKGPHAPVLQIRECLQKVYGDSSLRDRLEEILQKAVGDTRVRLCSSHVPVNQSEEPVAARGDRREQPC